MVFELEVSPSNMQVMFDLPLGNTVPSSATQVLQEDAVEEGREVAEPPPDAFNW
jgi:hypothetical protein